VTPGHGWFEVERSGTRSVVTRALAGSPLRLLMPANHGHAAWIYTSSFGGGLVDGDHTRLAIGVGRDATAFVTTQSSTKVYRSPRGTCAELHGRIAEGGLLVVAPDPVVPFAGARYRQVQRFQIADTGALVVVDCCLSGRSAAGERWAFSEYRSLLEISIGGRLLVHDAVALRQEDGALAPRLGRLNALAVAVIAGSVLRPHAERLVAISSAQPVVQRAGQLMTASPLGEDGCIVRIGGGSAEKVGRTLREMLQFLPARLGDDPWRRKW